MAFMLAEPRLLIATMFVFGILAREAYGAWQDFRPPKGAVAFVALAAAPASFFMFLPEIASDYPSMPDLIAHSSRPLRYLLLGPILTGVVLLAARGDNAIARFAAWGPVRTFGIISYSYYLSHGIAIHFVERALLPLVEPGYHSIPLAFGIFVLSFGLTVLVALVFFALVEYPFSIGRRVAY
jgi:peptidoglycan/LPS O-acetylase OafA/YrhL